MSHHKIVFFSANPIVENRDVGIRFDKEHKAIQKAVQKKSKLILETYLAVSKSDWQAFFYQNESYFGFHFCGHGDKNGIFLQKENDKPDYLKNKEVVTMFERSQEKAQLAFFNSCDSYVLAQQIQVYIPYVVGVKGEIYDNEAIDFAQVFYHVLMKKLDLKRFFDNTHLVIETPNNAYAFFSPQDIQKEKKVTIQFDAKPIQKNNFIAFFRTVLTSVFQYLRK